MPLPKGVNLRNRSLCLYHQKRERKDTKATTRLPVAVRYSAILLPAPVALCMDLGKKKKTCTSDVKQNMNGSTLFQYCKVCLTSNM
ncbi:hypothetical protein KL86CLO1_11058 [uncultured Eubacteriales bacterium]|uniref:Uncharacterized protein n=1 Tax=uncultured Eubacteriales bacterium TaxID=172733 RepID=A0A212JH42_9FIRM|nr:hypothetical protein KL86CLO1_11058 [uncultured Eubacteriales bacterium]